jgi:hypothetical protein
MPASPQVTRRTLLRGAVGMAATLAGAAIRRAAPPVLALARAGTMPTAAASAPLAASVVVQWNSAALQAIRDTRPGPPQVARMLAIVHTAIYDAWSAYDPVALGTRLGGSLRRPVEEHMLANKQQAISYAAYRALVDLFPSQVAKFDALLGGLGYDPADTSIDGRTPTGIGNVTAQALLDFRHHDGSNQLGDLHPGAYSDYTGYQPVNTWDRVTDPNQWQPLRVPDGHGGFVVQQYIAPFWGGVTPFALSTGSQLRPDLTLPQYPSDEYRRQAAQILEYSANLTDEQKVIAEYWADGPASELPPGHWSLIAQDVSRRDGNDLDADVKLFFLQTNAVLDAGICCWDCKRVFTSVRPITAIRYLYVGQRVLAWGGPYQGTQHIDGGDWQPYQAETFVTPAFAEFTSGHSTFSAASAEVLKRFTGSDAYGGSYVLPAGMSKFEPGAVPEQDVTLTWATFSDAADEAGLSRRYGGIHFEQGDVMGRILGRHVGAQVWEKAQGYISGQGG